MSSKTWLSSDTHFGHFKIIQFCNRPFNDVEEMNRVLIERWNEKVSSGDEVWFLGDFSMHGSEDVFFQLNGNKHLIIGNHDKQEVKKLPWASQHIRHEMKLNEDGVTTKLVLDHYGMRVWNGLHQGAIQLYGHSHNSLPGFRTPKGGGTLDVGVDSWNFYPVNITQIKERLKTLPVFSAEERD